MQLVLLTVPQPTAGLREGGSSSPVAEHLVEPPVLSEVAPAPKAPRNSLGRLSPSQPRERGWHWGLTRLLSPRGFWWLCSTASPTRRYVPAAASPPGAGAWPCLGQWLCRPPACPLAPWGGHSQGKAPALSLPTTAGEVRDEEEVAALEARPPSALLRPVMREAALRSRDRGAAGCGGPAGGQGLGASRAAAALARDSRTGTSTREHWSCWRGCPQLRCEGGTLGSYHPSLLPQTSFASLGLGELPGEMRLLLSTAVCAPAAPRAENPLSPAPAIGGRGPWWLQQEPGAQQG